jgi:diaminopimelate epimerase
MTGELRAVKGHGTENDFVLVRDLDAVLSVSPTLVRALCDRRAGVGADGLLRVVRTELATEPDVRAQAGVAPYFMDYHNADGSIAEMCGNGVRVFARYLSETGLAGDRTTVATRGGPRAVTIDGELITVDMGPVQRRSEQPKVRAVGLVGSLEGLAVELPNPHVVVELDTVADLAELELEHAPTVEPPLPEGQNVEFFVRTGVRAITMRVHERGVGETRSCGTGICAAAFAAAGGEWQAGEEWSVEVPGGRCSVTLSTLGSVLLSGPAVLVAELSVSQNWLADHR